jgi:prevent-host-death family protein
MGEAPQAVAVSEFKATCLKLLEQVRRTGTPVLVTKRGEPIAMVVPVLPPPPQPSWLGMGAGSARIVGDIMAPLVAESDWEVTAP